MAPEPRPKGANAPISFTFSNAMSSINNRSNINNLPAHAWNTASHAKSPLSQSMTASDLGGSATMAGPPTSASPSLISIGSGAVKNATQKSPSPANLSLQSSFAAANPVGINASSSYTPQVVQPSAFSGKPTTNTAAVSSLYSTPPLPSLTHAGTALTAAAYPEAASLGPLANSSLRLQSLEGRQVAGAITNAASIPAIGSSLPKCTPFVASSTSPFASNTARTPVQASQSPFLAPNPALSGISEQSVHSSTHWADQYTVEKEFCALATRFPVAFETLVGLYLQESGRTPAQISQKLIRSLTCPDWERDLRRKDILNSDPKAPVERWVVPNDPLFLAIVAEVARYPYPFEASIRWFALKDDDSGFQMEQIVRKAGWTTWPDTSNSQAFRVMHNIFTMAEGEEKDQKLAQAKAESPLLFDYCLRDPFCGAFSEKKRKRVDLEETVVIHYSPRGREERVVESKPKRVKMSTARPMQVHNVPLEERAFDSKGNRLPWALEWPEGHPNARGQKRHVEEKGPFGKSNKRKGSSRTRTATPAKKENPTLDSFEKALNYDLKKQAESPADNATPSRSQNDAPSVNKEPTQVLLYGYPSSRQWQALDTYEKICGGIICEDYERQPDSSLRRYPNPISNAPRAHMTRPLSKAEKALAFQYAGGAHWVKVTFDSAEAAERAIENSPIQFQQHWVYAQPYYHGIAPQHDAPIEMTGEERSAGRPLSKHNQIYGPSSVQQTGAVTGGPFTVPPNSILNTSTSTPNNQQPEDVSLTSSTASSGTATGPESAQVRRRGSAQTGHQVQTQQANPRMMRHFPDTPRTILRPAHEALLPQPSFWERQSRWLADHGLMPGEIIGNGVPLLDNGQIDWPRTSFYWRFFYWVDSTFGTDYCGLRNDD